MALKAGADARAAELTALGERELRDRILTRPRPRHVAIIMDGNGRWATSRGMPRVAGHSEGVKAVRNTVRTAGEVGIEYLTLYAFSSENWNRPSHEVSTLMSLLERSIDRELPELMTRNVRFRVIGRPNGVPPEVQRRIDHVVNATAANSGLTLLMAFNYGARDEIVDACRRLARDVRDGRVEPEEIDEVRIVSTWLAHHEFRLAWRDWWSMLTAGKPHRARHRRQAVVSAGARDDRHPVVQLSHRSS